MFHTGMTGGSTNSPAALSTSYNRLHLSPRAIFARIRCRGAEAAPKAALRRADPSGGVSSHGLLVFQWLRRNCQIVSTAAWSRGWQTAVGWDLGACCSKSGSGGAPLRLLAGAKLESSSTSPFLSADGRKPERSCSRPAGSADVGHDLGPGHHLRPSWGALVWFWAGCGRRS